MAKYQVHSTYRPVVGWTLAKTGLLGTPACSERVGVEKMLLSRWLLNLPDRLGGQDWWQGGYAVACFGISLGHHLATHWGQLHYTVP